jgi:hypothetical protein
MHNDICRYLHSGYEPHERSVAVKIALCHDQGSILDHDAHQGEENAKQT